MTNGVSLSQLPRIENHPSSGSSESKSPSRQQIESAAQQFEALLLHQLLKSASGGEGGWLGTGEEDSAGLQAMDLAQEHLAAALSARGGLGLAKIVTPQLMGDPRSISVSTTKSE
jgi:Rod binding domain-containing protein